MDKGKLKRGGQVLAPSLFTMGNMACGFYAVIAAHVEDFNSAAIAILAGIVFDMLDGRVARMVHGESSFGVEFDSLSDFLTFGVAPAYMMYSFTLKDYGVMGGVVSFLFTLGGGFRLARFNAIAQAGKGSKTHFQGLPIPAGAGFLASFVLLYGILEQPSPARTLRPLMNELPLLVAVGPVIMLALSFLMVSTVPYAAFKQSDLFKTPNLRLLVIVGSGLGLIYYYPQNALFLFFLTYVLSGLAGLIGKARKVEKVDEGPPSHDGLA
jgi:CDP-diacylglycerol--serine O-phosphatidyltransferase